MMDSKRYNVIDLFCGCGGFSLGFENAGFDVLLGIDNWKDAIKTFQHNHKKSKTLLADLSLLEPSETLKLLGDNSVDIVIGGPPCQGFSIAGKRIVNDSRNKLYRNFVHFVDYYKPKAFVMENVPNILSIGGGLIRDSILDDFSRLGYTPVFKVLTASDYGVPQNRRRAFFVGLLNGQRFEFPIAFESEKVTSSQAISDLPETTVNDGEDYPIPPQSAYQRLMRQNSKNLNNHQTTAHNQTTIDIISLVPDGGNYKDLPTKLQDTRKVNIAWTRLNSQKPSFTIDTGHRHHFH
ncbi:MAG: DNA cytosine methyltransferase, partial [Muribaculaceae bacterium]|nr:DNA cytosine methyltransferase [Muribaculaceae bacterium]